jgi:hypothetical protein
MKVFTIFTLIASSQAKLDPRQVLTVSPNPTDPCYTSMTSLGHDYPTEPPELVLWASTVFEGSSYICQGFDEVPSSLETYEQQFESELSA